MIVWFAISGKHKRGEAVIQPFPSALQAVCFDLDWTLSYYPLSSRQVLEESLIRAGVPAGGLGDLASAADRYDSLWLAMERMTKSTEALRLQIMTALFLERGIDDADAVARVARAYGDIRQESGVLAYPGVAGLLADLKPHYKLGLLTNGPSDLQWGKIQGLGFDAMFDAIVVAGDVGIYKPDIDVFRMLLRSLNVPAENTLFVGDNYEADILGAHRAGMHTAWIQRSVTDTADVPVRPTFVASDTVWLREVLL